MAAKEWTKKRKLKAVTKILDDADSTYGMDMTEPPLWLTEAMAVLDGTACPECKCPPGVFHWGNHWRGCSRA